jgi:ABC-type nitrate/sulfonate/bicarbonate transport system substrate-binding protein
VPNTYAAEKQGLRKFSAIRDLKIRQLITVTGITKKFLRERRDTAEAFLRAYVEGIFRVKTEKDTSMRVIGQYTRLRDPEVLSKFYDELVPDLPRIPYIEDASIRATLDAMQSQGPALPKIDPKALYDNSLLNALAAEGFVEKLKPRER